MFGYDADELIGQSVGILRADGDGACVSRMIAQYLDGAEARFIGPHERAGCAKENGETFVVEIGMNEMRLADSRLFIAVTRTSPSATASRAPACRHRGAPAALLRRADDRAGSACSIMERQVQREMLRSAGRLCRHAGHPLRRPRAGSVPDQNRTYAMRWLMRRDMAWPPRSASCLRCPSSTGWRPVTPLGDLIRELNDQLRAALPVGRFCRRRAGVPEKDGLNGEVWAGGVPGVLLLAEDGSIRLASLAAVAARHHHPVRRLPSLPVSFEARPGQQIVVYSDGLTEATNAAGEMFGEQRLLAALAGSDAGTTRGRQAGTCRASCRRPQPGRCLAPAARLRAKPLRGRLIQSAGNRSSNGPTPGKHGAALHRRIALG